MEIKFDKRPLAKNFKYKNCLLRATYIVKNSDEEKYMYTWIRNNI